MAVVPLEEDLEEEEVARLEVEVRFPVEDLVEAEMEMVTTLGSTFLFRSA